MSVFLSFISNTAFNFVIGLLLARFLGPEDYGRFALGLAIAVGLQTIAFDWARVASTRFYSEKIAREEPKLRATVDAALAILVLLILAGTLAVTVSGIALPLSRGLMALAAATAIVNGLFDYGTALIRARFLDSLYARLIISKNLFSMVLTLGGAYWFGSAAMAMLGLCVSMAGALVSVRRTFIDPAASRHLVDPRLAKTLFRYALPVVVANLIYQTIPLVDRLMIARLHGFAQSGQFSLAYDIGIRVVAAIGSALDVLLFQIAVRADEIHGTPTAKQQIGDNIGIVFAVLTPACVGLWLVVPSFEQVIVPSEFRGPFAHDLRLLLPGLFCYGMIFFAIQPLFQIHKRTGPLIAVALFASLVNAVCMLAVPASADAGAYAQIQGVALALAMALLAGWALSVGPVWPRTRDLLGCVAATACMIVAWTLVRGINPGIVALISQVIVGAGAYGITAYALNVCGLRARIQSLIPIRFG